MGMVLVAFKTYGRDIDTHIYSLTWPASIKFIWTEESVCIRKEFNSQGTGLGHQHGRRFIVLGHQYGRRDVMWKHFIEEGNEICMFK